jgi:hypothetical protein
MAGNNPTVLGPGNLDTYSGQNLPGVPFPSFIIEELEARRLLTIIITNPYPGLTLIYETQTSPQAQHIHIARIDLNMPGLGFETTPHSGASDTTSQTTLGFLNSRGGQLAINANFFTPVSGVPAPVDIVGFAASLTRADAQAGQPGTDFSLFQAGSGFNYAIVANAPALNIAANNTVSILHYDPDPDPAKHNHALEVNQGLVTLGNAISGSAQIVDQVLVNGVLTAVPTIPTYNGLANGGLNPGNGFSDSHSWYNDVRARTAIGFTADNKLLLFTVDAAGGSVGMTVPQVAQKLIDYGAIRAINLDGGGSTNMSMQDPATGTRGIINVQSDLGPNPGTDPGRLVANSLVAFFPSVATPMTLAASAVNASGNATLTWQGAYGDADKIIIERSTDTQGWSQIASDITAKNLTYTVGGLSQSTRYYFRAKASRNVESSGYSNTAVIDYVPTPSNLAGTAVNGSGQSTLTWTGNYGPPDTVYLEWYNSNTFIYQNAGSTPAANLNGLMSGLDPHFTYQARAHAHSSFGNDSGYAYTTLNPSLAPRNPINLSATQVNQYGYTTLNWQGTYWTGDAVREEQSSNGVNFTEVHVSAAKYLSDSIFGLSQNTHYYFRIRITNSAGSSAYSNVVHIGPQLQSPPTPFSLTADAISNSTSVLHWQGSGWGSYDVLHVYQSTDGINFIDVTTTSPIYLIDYVYNLTAGQTYYFKVRVVNQSGIWSDFSNVAITS